MPYVKRGNTVYKREGGKLVKVGKSNKVKAYLRVLRAVEKGWRPNR